MHVVHVSSSKPREVIDITSHVRTYVETSNVQEGIVCIHALHATCAIVVNEYEELLASDYLDFFSALLPKISYRHNTIDNNAEAHLLSALLHSGKTIPISKGRLVLGTWQRILLIELDGPRKRTIALQIVPVLSS